MSKKQVAYIAGIGMVTSVGANFEMTAAAVKAGISGYAVSDFYGQADEPITMASVPDSVFSEIDAEIDEGDRYNERHDRVIKMAIIAVREACAQQSITQPIPLILAMAEEHDDSEGLSPLITNLEHNCKPWVDSKNHRSIHSGRAAGMEAIDLAFRYLTDLEEDFILVGGSDSYRDYSRLDPLTQENRLLTTNSMDGFAPGEAGGFLLLTRHPELAMQQNGSIVALNIPGIADEPGHIGSEVPYRGDGLDQAFRKALVGCEETKISSIYSSMNGENHWAKEYGVAYMRNKSAFSDQIRTEHPADCFGDVGVASSPILIALAAENLNADPTEISSLAYSSSDSAKRGAIVIEKTAVKAKH